jgi:hypothetical protein
VPLGAPGPGIGGHEDCPEEAEHLDPCKVVDNARNC